MFEIETTKKAKEYFRDNHADWLLIDTCDCRNDFWTLESNPKVRVCSSIIADKTIRESATGKQFKRISVFSVTMDEWQGWVDKFCEFILKFYPEDRIILNEFRFAKYYLKDGTLGEFTCADQYARLGNITKNIEDMLKKKMPKMHILSPQHDNVGDYYSHIGVAPMHYLDEIWMRQVRKLERIIE